MSVAFSTDSTAQLCLPAEAEDKKKLDVAQLQHAFDIERTAKWIDQNNFQRVSMISVT